MKEGRKGRNCRKNRMEERDGNEGGGERKEERDGVKRKQKRW